MRTALTETCDVMTGGETTNIYHVAPGVWTACGLAGVERVRGGSRGRLYIILSCPVLYIIRCHCPFRNCAVNLARERRYREACGRARCGGALQWHTHGPCACRTTAGAGIRLMRSGWSTSGYAAPAPALCQRHNGTQGVSARHGCTEHEGNRACLAYAYAAVPFKGCSVRAPSLRATARMIHQTKAL